MQFAGISDAIVAGANAVKAANGAAAVSDETVAAGIGTISNQLGDIAFKLESGGRAGEELKATLTELLEYMRRVAAKIAA